MFQSNIFFKQYFKVNLDDFEVNDFGKIFFCKFPVVTGQKTFQWKSLLTGDKEENEYAPIQVSPKKFYYDKDKYSVIDTSDESPSCLVASWPITKLTPHQLEKTEDKIIEDLRMIINKFFNQ